MTDSITRWGILGTATIARKNWHSIWHSGNGTLTAIASRSTDRAQQFINECQSEVPFASPPRAIGSYEDILTADDVDAIYIPLPTGMRTEWAVRAAEAGKHVLCEKPCGVDADELRKILEACKANGVQFMDGVMFMHSQRLDALRKTLDDDSSIGRLRRISMGFSFCAPDEFLQENIRVSSRLEPMGCLGDLGWYTSRFALWVMKYSMPGVVSGRLLSSIQSEGSQHPTPTEFTGDLFFDDGITASFYCSFRAEHQQWAHLSGSKGHLLVRDFVLPFCGAELSYEVSNHHFDIQGCRFNMEQHTRRVAVNEYGNNHETAQETRLFRNFATQVQSGSVDPHWGDIALKTQRILDALVTSSRDNGALIEP